MNTNRPTGDANPGPDFDENTAARPSGSGNPGPKPYGTAPHPDEHVDKNQGVDGLD